MYTYRHVHIYANEFAQTENKFKGLGIKQSFKYNVMKKINTDIEIVKKMIGCKITKV